jgi:ankyrin repeat protein
MKKIVITLFASLLIINIHEQANACSFIKRLAAVYLLANKTIQTTDVNSINVLNDSNQIMNSNYQDFNFTSYKPNNKNSDNEFTYTLFYNNAENDENNDDQFTYTVKTLPNTRGYNFLQEALAMNTAYESMLNDADVAAINNHGENALHIAAAYGRVYAVKELAKNPAIDINAVNDDGNTALHIAAMSAEIYAPEVIDALLAHPAIDVTIKNKQDQNFSDLVYDLYKSGKYEVKKQLSLLQAYFDVNYDHLHRRKQNFLLELTKDHDRRKNNHGLNV